MSEKETIEEFMARMRVIIPNRQNFSVEKLAMYIGKCIAWCPDGASIADNYDSLDVLIKSAGYEPSRCIFDYVSGLASF